MPIEPATAERGVVLVTETTRLTHIFGSYARTSAHDLASVVVPQDEQAAYTLDDRSVCKWSLASGALLHRAPLPKNDARAKATRAVGISADGATLFYGRTDGHLVAWDIAAGDIRWEILAARGTNGTTPSAVRRIAVSPDGSRVATSCEGEGVVRLFAGRLLEGQLAGDDPLAFSPDGAVLVLGGAPEAAALVDPRERRGTAQLTEKEAATCAAFSPDGRLVATGHRGFAQVYDRASRRIAWREAVPDVAPGTPAVVHGVFFSADGRAVWACAGGIEARDASSGVLARKGAPSVPRPACAPASSLLLGVSGKKLVMVDTNTFAERRGAGHTDSITSVAFSRDGQRVASGGRDRVARIWDLKASVEIGQVPASAPVSRVAFTPDGDRLVVGDGASVLVADATLGTPVAERAPAAGDGVVTDLVVLPNGDVVVAAEGVLRRWSPSGGDLWRSERHVHSVHLEQDGLLRVVGREGVWLVAPATGAATLCVESMDRTRAQPHFPCLGGLLSIVTGRGLVLRDAKTGDALRTFAGSENALAILAVSPDARTAIVCTSDEPEEDDPTTLPLFEIWDVAAGARRDSIDLGTGDDRPISAAFSPDGASLAIGTARGVLLVFAITTPPLPPARDVVNGLLRDAAASNAQGGLWADELLVMRQAHAHAEQGLDEDDPDRLMALAGLAEVLTRLGRLDEAGPLHERALATAERIHGPESAKYGRVAANAARWWLLHGDASRALTLHQASLEAFRLAFGAEHPEVAMALSNVGFAYLSLGDLDRAGPPLEQAVELFQKTTGERDIECARAMHNLGRVHGQAGERERAQPLLERSLQVRRALLGADHLDVGEGLTTLGTLFLMSGEPALAEPLFRESLWLHERMLGEYHPIVAARAADLAAAVRATGGVPEAVALLERALVIRTERLGPSHADTQRTATTLAALHRALEEPKEELSEEAPTK